MLGFSFTKYQVGLNNLCVFIVLEKTYLVGTRADSVQNAAVTGHSLAMYARFGNPYGYDLFMPNPYAQIVGWASNLFY